MLSSKNHQNSPCRCSEEKSKNINLREVLKATEKTIFEKKQKPDYYRPPWMHEEKWSHIFQVLKEETVGSRVLYLVKLPSREGQENPGGQRHTVHGPLSHEPPENKRKVSPTRSSEILKAVLMNN